MNGLASLCPPVLTCSAAHELETQRFGGDESGEWAAMQAAGRGVGAAILRDAAEIGGVPADGSLLVLVGKGHNGGDALIAAQAILAARPQARADLLFAFGERSLRPLAARAWRELVHAHGPRCRTVGSAALRPGGYDVGIDGVFGFQFRPPADARTSGLFNAVNALPIRLRAAVDLPSAGLCRADFTYATGSVKQPLLDAAVAGRVRYIDLGFFREPIETPAGGDRVLTRSVLAGLRQLRPARCDKRSFGHVFLVGGSRSYPGAILMATMAAVRSGAGLVTAFVPESLLPGFAARLPEAIWVAWPETPAGSLALEGEHLLRERADRADAFVIGPGIGREPETLALVESIVCSAAVPLVIDADALQRDLVLAGEAPRVVTPHAGEFRRIAGDADLRTFAGQPHLTVVLKGPVTRISQGREVYHAFGGGPVLARGGSGDVLAGMIGTQLGQSPDDPLSAAARAVYWHGAAAETLARAEGQVAVQTTQLLEHLGPALHAS